jgi:hypothetical protein
MTCAELRSYLEELASANSGVQGYSAEVTEHIRICEECSRFAGEQNEVKGLLKLVRDAAPQVSPLLDSAILANFRKRVERAPVSGVVAFRRRSAPLFWRGAIAAAILLVVMLPWAYRRSDTAKHSLSTVDLVAPSKPMPAENTASSIVKENSPAKGMLPHRARRKSARPAAATPAAVASTRFPAGFDSLMYCDPLSCAGTMEVIRMQLPTGVLGRRSARQPSQGIVYADVVIGSDGVARGIRFVE